MASSRRRATTGRAIGRTGDGARGAGRVSAGAARSAGTARTGRTDTRTIVVGIVAVVAVVAAIAFVALSGGGSNGTWVEQGRGGSWSNVSADTLATMLKTKDFTLLNVKTPYVGEIDGTDLYIPYTDLAARASELPTDKAAKIVVYCRAGNESRVATQTLLDLGYTNVWNLDKGMESWTASGRTLIQKARA
jgi:rhodanese-related sulfurtransferase